LKYSYFFGIIYINNFEYLYFGRYRLMVKWVRITQNQYFGVFALGFVFFILQELPYIIIPLVHMKSNPLMEMQDKSALLNAVEKILGISCVVFMLFFVRGDVKWFSLSTAREIIFFSVAIAAISRILHRLDILL